MNIAVLQYGELQTYDGMVYLNSDISNEEKSSLEEMIEKEDEIDTYSEILMKNKTVKSKSGEEEIYLSVPVKRGWIRTFS